MCSLLVASPPFSNRPTISECGQSAVIWYTLDNGRFESVCRSHKGDATRGKWSPEAGWRTITYEEAAVLTVMGS